MTLAQAVRDIQGRVNVSLDIGFDPNDPNQVTAELMSAARIVSRDTYWLQTLHSPLTLTACVNGSSAGAEIDILRSTVSTKQIFHCFGIHINGTWLEEIQFPAFMDSFPSYFSDLSHANPTVYVPLSPSLVRLHQPPNATAVAATDNFATGFYLHDAYTWPANQDTELEGPSEFHDLIIIRCYLDITEGYVNGADALRRRGLMQKRYEDDTEEIKAINMNRVRKIRRKRGGREVSIVSIHGARR